MKRYWNLSSRMPCVLLFSPQCRLFFLLLGGSLAVRLILLISNRDGGVGVRRMTLQRVSSVCSTNLGRVSLF